MLNSELSSLESSTWNSTSEKELVVVTVLVLRTVLRFSSGLEQLAGLIGKWNVRSVLSSLILKMTC